MKPLFYGPLVVLVAFTFAFAVLFALGQIACDLTQKVDARIACSAKLDAQLNAMPKDPQKAEELLQDVTKYQ